jgi:integrase
VAREHELRFDPALLFLFSTGVQRGELLGLKWEDVDFERCRVTIRLGIGRGMPTTPDFADVSGAPGRPQDGPWLGCTPGS